MIFILIRALVYASLFIGFFLVFLPARIVARTGMAAPAQVGALEIAAVLLTAAGALLALSCVLAFAFLGRGTPMVLDPPRRLVVRGPYRFVRNPMYVGAGAALLGAALYYRSLPLAGYAVLFLAVMAMLVHFYEEPKLRATFGADYDDYTRRVGRWLPRFRS